MVGLKVPVEDPEQQGYALALSSRNGGVSLKGTRKL